MAAELTPNKGIVMIIDDTPENLALLSDTLSEAGYRVLVAIDGLSALEQIGYLLPDIILLDVIMPGLNGYETCKRLKNNPATAHIPVLFMTALGDLDDLLKGFGEGAMDYLVKPIRPPEVLARVDVQLQQAHQVKRAEEALNHGTFAALAIDANAMITWLPAAARWLSDLLQLPGLQDQIRVGMKIPEPILEWSFLQMANGKEKEAAPFESIRGSDHFVAKLMPCMKRSEY